MGSLGSGNHFARVDVVDRIYEQEHGSGLRLAARPGCRPDPLRITRAWARSLYPVFTSFPECTTWRYRIVIPDRELVVAPVSSEEGRDYMAAMAAAASRFANRQVLAHAVRSAFERSLAGKVQDWSLAQVYDVAHNIAKIEDHVVDGKQRELIVHRKGTTRAFLQVTPRTQ